MKEVSNIYKNQKMQIIYILIHFCYNVLHCVYTDIVKLISAV